VTANLLSIPAAAEIIDGTLRHVGELIEAGELQAVDIAVHRSKPGTTEGADGKTYPSRKRRLKVTAESVRAFIQRRTIGQKTPPRKRKPMAGVIEYFT
jgi:hypothetical protein